MLSSSTPRVLVLLLALPAAALAQGAHAAADSADALRRARKAQERFESFRQMHLPQSRGGAVRCDVRIGRYCYGYEDTDVALPAEPPRIARARESLLAELERRAAAIPGDGWLTGQRVRYLVEGGRLAEAAAVAAACRSAEPGWCGALAGLALHAGGNSAGADSAFAAAAAQLPDDARCAWLDLTPLLEGELRKRYRAGDCAERAALAERVWWLARPFLASEGNDLRTEHHARVTTAQLYDRARNPYNPSWGRDAREVLVRYGSPLAWTRDRFAETGVSGGAGPRITGYEASPSYYFFPDVEAVESPARATADHWTLGAPRAPARYAVPYARRVVEIDPQIALFRRGDSTLAVAAYDVASAPTASTATVALALARDERTPPVLVRAAPGQSRGALTATAPWRPSIVGVEALAADGAWGARARRGTAPAGVADARSIALSDVLLVEPDSVPPATLAEALPRARPTTRVRRGETVGLFWEVYGTAGRTEDVAVALAVRREHASLRRRWSEALRLARRPEPVRLRWTTRPDDPRQLGTGGVTLGLAELPPGRYGREVTLRGAAGDSARAVRHVVIER